MNIREAKTEIVNTVKAYTRKNASGHYVMPPVRQRPILLIGPPGIGKTAIMEQVASECGIGLVAYTITHHTRQSAVGLPVVVHKNYQGREYTVTEYTMSEIIASVYECMEKTGCKEGILFIDEINCVSETLTPTMLQFLQCKTFGTHAVPAGWIIVAAGNPVEYNKSAREFDIVTLDRVKRMDVEADYEVWKEYAYQKGIHPAVISYLNLKKEYFYYVDISAGDRAFVTARGWEDLSEMLKSYEELELSSQESLIFQYIQEKEIAADFARFYQLYEKYGQDYQIDRVLSGNETASEHEQKIQLVRNAGQDERLVFTEQMLAGLNKSFASYIEENGYVIWLHENLKQISKEVEAGCSMEELIGKKRHAMQIKLENGLMTPKEASMEERIVNDLENCSLNMKMERIWKVEDRKQMIREMFAQVLEKRNQKVSVTQDALDRGFAFVEEAFGNGMEMTFFVSELSHNQNAMEFIRTFGSEKFLLHGEQLKLSKKRRELLDRIERLTYE